RSTEDRSGLLNYMGFMVSDGIYGSAALLRREVLLGATGPLISVRKLCPRIRHEKFLCPTVV
ncbi:MAG: hypothetical protein WB696_02035, partial [Chthoniobacterales bacterium]